MSGTGPDGPLPSVLTALEVPCRALGRRHRASRDGYKGLILPIASFTGTA